MDHQVNPTWKGWGSQMKCMECGNDLPRYARPDRLFCDDTCRKRHSRRPQKVDRGLVNVGYELSQVRLYLKSAKNEAHVQKVNERLKWLRQEIDEILRLRDRETIIQAGHRDELIAGMRRDR